MAYYNRYPKPLNKLVKEFIRDFPQHKEIKKGMILSFWPEVVGSAIANQSENIHFEGSKLIVHIKNPAWRHELHLQRYSIAAKLNQSVNEKIIKEIIIRS